MGNIKQFNIKNRAYYFFKDINSIKDFDSNLLKIGKVIQKHWYILHWIHHNKKINDYEIIHSVNPLHLVIGEVDGYIGKSNGNKCLVFASIDWKWSINKVHRVLEWN